MQPPCLYFPLSLPHGPGSWPWWGCDVHIKQSNKAFYPWGLPAKVNNIQGWSDNIRHIIQFMTEFQIETFHIQGRVSWMFQKSPEIVSNLYMNNIYKYTVSVSNFKFHSWSTKALWFSIIVSNLRISVTKPSNLVTHKPAITTSVRLLKLEVS